MNSRPLLCLVLALSSSAVQGDDQVRSTQEELRRRNIFFGDVDGRHTRELEEALKRYQSRKGLAPTGHEDRDTLRSLGLAARDPGEPPPKELEWPEEPVLKSDIKIDVAATAEQISTTSGVSLSSLIPDRVGTSSLSRRADNRRPSPSQQEASRPGRPLAGGAGFSLNQNGKLQTELTTYLRGYLQAVGHNRLENELHYYADHVDYLGNGVVDRRIIEQSLRRYYQHWPSRSYSQTGPVGYKVLSKRGEIAVTFRTKFSLRNSKSHVRGETENRVVINAATSDPRIVSIEERRIRH